MLRAVDLTVWVQVESRLNAIAARKCEVEALSRQPKLCERSSEVGFGLGVPALAQRLVTLQHSHIRKELPNVSRNILERLKELQAQLESLGPPEVPTTLFNILLQTTSIMTNVFASYRVKPRVASLQCRSSTNALRR